MNPHIQRMVAVGAALLRTLDAGLIPDTELAHAASLASKVRRGVVLTIAEARTAHRILTRSPLDGTGIVLPAAPEPEPQAEQADPNRPIIKLLATGRIGVFALTDMRETLKKLPGAKPETRHEKVNGKTITTVVWHYPATPASAAAILHALHGSRPRVSAKVTALAAEYGEHAQHRTVLDETAPLPVFDTTTLIKPGFELMAHQRRAVEFITNMTASLHAIMMGGGKTLAAITAANRTEARRIIIVCPNRVRGVWPREVRKFSAMGWHIVTGLRESKRARSGYVSMTTAERLREAEACLFDCACGAPVHAAVINYDALARPPWSTWKPPAPIDLAIYDEIHRAKAHNGKTSKVLARWVDFTHKRVGLTGTPMPQTPLDIFGIYRALDPAILGTSWTMFRNRYAITGPLGDYHIVGIKNTEELAEKFFSITYRPTIDLDLPPVTDVTRTFELEPEARRIYDQIDTELWADLSDIAGRGRSQEWREASIDFTEWLADTAEQHGFDVSEAGHLRNVELIDAEADEGEKTVTAANIMVRLLRLQQLTGGSVFDDEHNLVRVSTGKAELLAEVLDEVGCTRTKGDLDHKVEPVVVFCRFRSDLDAVEQVASAGGLTYAELSGRRSDGLTRDAELTPNADVVGVQIQSGGTGVDLTRARVAVWYSLGYSLSDYDQARKRLDRPGQTRPVLMVHLLAEDTADMDVYDGLESRRTVIAAVLDSHGIDPAAFGVKDERHEQAASGDAHKTRRGGAVALPFDKLLTDGRTKLGAPTEAKKEQPTGR